MACYHDLDLILREGETAATVTVRWRRLGTALFSPAAWACYAALVAAALVVTIRRPYLLPTYNHPFFTRSSLLVLTLGFVLGSCPCSSSTRPITRSPGGGWG